MRVGGRDSRQRRWRLWTVEPGGSYGQRRWLDGGRGGEGCAHARRRRRSGSDGDCMEEGNGSQRRGEEGSFHGVCSGRHAHRGRRGCGCVVVVLLKEGEDGLGTRQGDSRSGRPWGKGCD